MKKLCTLALLLTPSLALTGATKAHAQDDSSRGGNPLLGATPEVLAHSEDRIGFTIWKPKHVAARRLIEYAGDLTERTIDFFVQNPLNGVYERRQRARFVFLEDAIGIQDYDEGRKQALALLTMLDDQLGALEDDPASSPEASLTRTLRPRSMGVDAAARLLVEMGFAIEVNVVVPTGTLVLSGPTSQVARAESLLMEVDRPVPQMELYCTLIEAAAEPDDTSASLDADLVRGLAEFIPGRHFRSVGSLMLRGAAGAGSPFEVSSSMSGLGGEAGDTPARFVLSAVTQGWDSERGVLSLENCNFRLERPTYQSISNGSTVQKQFSGYRSEGLSTNLALRSGETTVVGSLGGDPVFIVLRFEIE